ncbi:copia protein [Tanacetum coccineum]
MQKAKKNMRKINFKKAVIQKFREYNQKLDALTNFNDSKAFKKAIQAKVLTEIKKLLPTHIPNAIENYVKPRLNTSVLEVMKTNQINLFIQSSTSTDDLSDMDLKIKLLNIIHSNKSNETHTTHHQLYDTLYESIILYQDALDAQAAQSSFHKRSHDNPDPPNNSKGENKKKHQKDAGKPSSRSSRQNRSPVVIVQDDTLAMQPLYQADTLIKKHATQNDIDKNENRILRPSTITIAKKFKELIQKDELTIADLEGAGLERLKVRYNNDVELEYHVSQLKEAVLSEAYTEEKYTTSITKHYVARYYKEDIEDRIPERWSKEVRRYHFEALNGIHHWEEDKIDFFKAGMSVNRIDFCKAGMSVVTEGNVFSNLRIKLVVRIDVKKKWGYGFLTSIVVRISNDKEYEFSYADLPRLSVNNVEDIRTVIKNRVEDIQLGVESYQRTLNLTKPTINLIDILLKNKLGSDNKRLKGRDWTDYDVKSSRNMLKKIDEILRHREQIRRLEEYVGGRPKIVNPRTFTVVIGKHLPTNFKRKLQGHLRSNVDVFAWTYADMTGILRTIMVGGKPFNTEHKLSEYKHIEPAYIDDMVIKSASEEDMLMDIQETFDRLRSINMKLNPKKCSFGVEEGPFLGHLITKQGIKANPSKFKAITDLKPPRMLKEILSLKGNLAALSRFLSKGAYNPNQRQSIGNVPRGFDRKYKCCPTCEKRKETCFDLLRKHGTTRDRIKLPRIGKDHTSSRPCCKKAMKDSEVGHQVGEHYIEFKGHNFIKGQILVDFMAKTPSAEDKDIKTKKPETKNETLNLRSAWKLYTNRASSSDGSSAGLMLVNPGGKEYTYALRYEFETTNKEAEHEALLAYLQIAEEMDIKDMIIFIDSQLVDNHVKVLFEARQPVIKQ